jgi:ethanolamine utilization protein EutM
MAQSIGILEVVGMVSAAASTDAMVKAAYVEVYSMKRAGAGMIAVIIKGDLASVKEALTIGAEVAQRFGDLVAARTIARPYEGFEQLIAPDEKGGKG